MPAPDRSPYPVELILSQKGIEKPDSRFDLTLRDLTRQGAQQAGVADLAFRETDPLVDGTSAAAFLRLLDNAAARTSEGLAFGRLLLSRLLIDGSVKSFWQEIDSRRRAAGRPLHLQVILPRGLAVAGEGVPDLSEIPFELLADDHGFLFRRAGSALVRSLAGMESAAVSLEAGERALLAWANVRLRGPDSFLPEELFTAHETLLADLSSALGLTAVPPCAHATQESLSRSLEEHAPVALVSLVAHGAPVGGVLWLHEEGHPDFPRDSGQRIAARDLALHLRRAGAKVAFLWSCHGGRRHRVAGAVAEALLDPEQGGLAAVVASHTVLRASATSVLARALLQAFSGVAEGDLERAVGEARASLTEDDLQWAAPVYYARPFQGRSVTLAQAIAADLAEPEEEGRERAALLEGAPALTPYFQGRDDERIRCLAHLRTSHLVTVLGLPGSGKTELTLAVGNEALRDGILRLDRGLWISLAGVRSTESLAGGLALAFGLEKLESDEALSKAIGDRRVLLVLDNAEDLIVPDRSRLRSLLGTLLRLCTGLRVLLSSRRALGNVAGAPETEFVVGRLQPPADHEVFLAAAGARLTEEDRISPDLDPLVASLEGHPLSLVLIAGQAGRVSLGALRRRLDQKGIEALTADELWGDDLTQTPDEELRTKRLLSSLNLSFEPLRQSDPGAAELFACLGLLPSGLPSVLLAAIGNEGEEQAATLLRINLAEIQGRDRRLFLPAPVRLYAKRHFGRLPRDKKWAWLTEIFKVLGKWLDGADQQFGREHATSSFDALREEPNLAELLTADEESMTEDLPESLAEGVSEAFVPWSQLMRLSGRSSAALKLTVQAKICLARTTAAKPLADVSLVLGSLYVQTSRLWEAEEEYRSALQIYRAVEDRLGEANARYALGRLYFRADRLGEAMDECQAALLIYLEIEERLGQANTRERLAGIFTRMSRLQEAEDEYQAVLSIYHEIGERLGEANTRKALGVLYQRTSRLQEAEQEYRLALSIHREIEDRLGEANARKELGNLYVQTSRLQEAEEEYLSALSIYLEVEDRLGEANTRKMLGYSSLLQQRPVAAYSQLLAVIPLYQAIEGRLGEAGTIGYLARAAQIAGRPDRGAVLAALCWKLHEEVEDRRGVALALVELSQCLLALEDHKGTVAAYALAWNLARSIGEPDAAERAEALRQIFPDFDPEAEPDPEWLAGLEETLRAAVARQEEALRAMGDDPLTPLPESGEGPLARNASGAGDTSE
jgi:tetratricopeptide (TPR) repeat protein